MRPAQAAVALLAVVAGCRGQRALLEELYKAEPGAKAEGGPVWPDTFSVQGQEVQYQSNGSSTPWNYSCPAAWYYDFPGKRARFDHMEGQDDTFCQGQNLSDANPRAACHLIFAPNKAMYVHYPTQKSCCMLCPPGIRCTVLKPDWIADGKYEGTEEISGARCGVYSKQGSVSTDYWMATPDTNVPCRYHEDLTKIYQGVVHNITWDRATYSTKPIPDSVFEVPLYCERLCPNLF